eukprot:TCONS_00014329-protein
MRFVVLLTLVATALAQQNKNEYDRIFDQSTIKTKTSFKGGDTSYTFAYQAQMKTLNPVIKSQSTGIKFKCLVLVNFLNEGSGNFRVRMELQNPQFFATAENPSHNYQIPTQTNIPIKQDILQELQRHIFFRYRNGVVKHIFHKNNEETLVVNLKRGIINLFSVDTLQQNFDETPFSKKLEKTIHGICNCSYTVLNEKEDVYNITKTIHTDQCRNNRNVFLSSIQSENRNSDSSSNTIRQQTTMNIELYQVQSNFKIFSVNATGLTMLYLLGEKRQPVMGTTHQILRLVQEKKTSKTYDYPIWRARDLMFYSPPQRTTLHRLNYKDTQKLGQFVHDTLVKLSTDHGDVTKPFTKEYGFKMMTLVNTLRPMRFNQLNIVWDKCLGNPKIRDLFMRFYSMLRTYDSMNLLNRKLRDDAGYVKPGMMINYFQMMTSPDYTDRQMVVKMKEICSSYYVRTKSQVQRACLLTAATLRRRFCSEKMCLWLQMPTEIRRNMAIQKFITLSEFEQIDYIQIAKSGSHSQMIQPLMSIIKNNDVSIRVRRYAILALAPLARSQTRTRVTNHLLKLLLHDTKQHEDLRRAVFQVLLENPTPSIISTCANYMIKERSVNIRRFIFDRLQSIARSKPDEGFQESKPAAQSAINFIKTQNLVPSNLRWIPQHYSGILKSPATGFSNMKISWDSQIHYTNESFLPKYILGQFDAKIFGRRFNLMDFQLETQGVQEFLARLSGYSPKDASNQTDLRLHCDVRLFGTQWWRDSRTFQHKENSAGNTPSEKFYTWKKLAEFVRNGLKMNAQKVFIPVETIIRIPTPTGFPFVYNMTSLLMHKMENFVQTKTPSLLDIPSFFFKTQEFKGDLIHKQRSLLFARGSVYFESPIATAGFHHNKTLNISFDAQLSMKANIARMEYTTDLELPKQPEMVTIDNGIEMFVQHHIDAENKKTEFTYKGMPVPFHSDSHKFVQDKDDAKSPKTDFSKLAPTMFLKLKGKKDQQKQKVSKYLVTRSNGDITISENSPQVWRMIPTNGNTRVVTLMAPGKGFINIDKRTKRIRMSKEKKTYFIVDFVSEGIQLKTVLPTDQVSQPKDNLKDMMKNITNMVNHYRKAGLNLDEIENAQKMIDEMTCESNCVDVYHFYYDETQRRWRPTKESEQLTTTFIAEIQKTSKHHYQNELYKSSKCYWTFPIPYCLSGIISKDGDQAVMTTKQFFKPMIQKFKLHHDVEKIQMKLEPSGNDDNRKYTFTVTSENSDKKFEMVWQHDKKLRQFEFDVYPDVTESRDRFMCMKMKYPENTLDMSVSFDKKCQEQHFKLTNLDKSGKARLSTYSMDFDWMVKFDDSIPVSTKFIPRSKWFYRQLKKFTQDDEIDEDDYDETTRGENKRMRSVKGDGYVSLISANQIRVRVNNSKHGFEKIFRVPTYLDRMPFGSKSYTFIGQMSDKIDRSVCIHKGNQFRTFDQVVYQYDTKKTKCEYTLMKTYTKDVSNIEVYVNNLDKEMKQMRIIYGDSEIQIKPKNTNQIPEVLVNGRRQRITASSLSRDGNKVTLANGGVIDFVWIPETKALFFFTKEMGIEIYAGGRAVHIRMSRFMSGKIHGMCGDMNSEQDLEMRAPEMVEVEDVTLFGLSWIVNGKKCTSSGCQFQRKDFQRLRRTNNRETWSCTTLVALPQCFSGCYPKKTTTLQNVPVKCTGRDRNTVQRMMDVSATTECQCSC